MLVNKGIFPEVVRSSRWKMKDKEQLGRSENSLAQGTACGKDLQWEGECSVLVALRSLWMKAGKAYMEPEKSH
jgi:hypothetical protein